MGNVSSEGEKRNTRTEICRSATLSTTNFTPTGVDSNPDFGSKR